MIDMKAGFTVFEFEEVFAADFIEAALAKFTARRILLIVEFGRGQVFELVG